MIAEFASHDAKWRAQVACKTPNLFVNFTVESIVTLRAGVPNGIVNVDTLGNITNQENRTEAIVTSVLYALGVDVLASLFISAPSFPSSASTANVPASALWAEWDPIATDADIPIAVSGMTSLDGSFLLGGGPDAFNRIKPFARRAVQNYAIAFHSAILVDVASTVDQAAGLPDTNILTNTTALQTRIQTVYLSRTYMTPIDGKANGLNISVPAAPYLLSHYREFKLPIAARKLKDEGVGAARLVQRYLCHSMVLKSPATLVVDVIVATTSMFMIAWPLSQLVLMYFAKNHSTSGNYCVCPTCDAHTGHLVPSVLKDELTPGEADVEAVEYV
ncbi:hypothetical protein FRC08_000900 [Ceratobasidium sp. 394]|nr:hypothetical protein FRC08_000900 [Ceratobasidium sp. 394]KAG9077824.1 hypothetical protein FS749_010231 [Ceratobasidium sp. UAMH 11750]